MEQMVGGCLSGCLSIECPQRMKHYEQCDMGPGHLSLQSLCIFPYLLPSAYLFFLTPSTLTFSQPYFSYFS